MNKKSVLVVSNQLTGNNSLSEWISARHPFDVSIVHSDETAIEVCHQNQFDMVVLDNTNDLINEKKIERSVADFAG